jgi:hypothetical protein
MTFASDQLLADLKSKTSALIQIAEKHFSGLTEEELNQRPAPDAWSIADCLEHLNLYAEYYHTMMAQKMEASNHMPNPKFRSGIIGNYFTNIMQVKNGKLNKMSSPKDKNPVNLETANDTLGRFIDHQQEMLRLLDRAKKANLGKVRIPITIYPWLKLKLGDTFRFSVTHNERHVIQAMNVLKAG